MRASRRLQDSRIKVWHNYQTVFLNLNILGPCSTLLLDTDCAYVCVGGAWAFPAAALSLAGLCSSSVQLVAGPAGHRHGVLRGSVPPPRHQPAGELLEPRRTKGYREVGKGREDEQSRGVLLSEHTWLRNTEPLPSQLCSWRRGGTGWEQQQLSSGASAHGPQGTARVGALWPQQFREGEREKFAPCLLPSDV